MTVEKVIFRIPPRDLTRASDATFQTHHEARVDRPLDDLDLDEVFQAVNGNLQVGDSVTICAYEGSHTDASRVLREYCTCRIIARGQENGVGPIRIRAQWCGPITTVDKPAKSLVKDKDQKLEVKKEFGGGFNVVDEKGHVIEKFKSKAEADAYIEHLLPKPAPKPVEAPKAKDGTKAA